MPRPNPSQPAPTSRLLRLSASALAALALITTAWILAVKLSEGTTMTGPGLVAMPTGLGGPFALIDHRKRPVTQAIFNGRLTLLYFGYSFCPDICPTTLQTLAAAMDRADDEHLDLAGAFITVDPARDTADHLSTYVPLFHKDLLGLTGETEMIDQTVRSFRASYRRRTDIDAEAYPVDHSSYIYLLAADGRLAAVFRHDATVEDMMAAIRRL